MTEPNGGRISISEDRLRALFAEFELRLTTTITRELAMKADVSTVTDLAKDIGSIRREQDERRHLVGDVAELRREMVELKTAEDGRSGIDKWRALNLSTVIAICAVLSLVLYLHH